MMETGAEGIIILPDKEDTIAKDSVKIIFSVFFDGTMNHRGQAEIGENYRKKVAQKKQSKEELKKIKKEVGYKDLASQGNDRSNVDLLQEYHLDREESDPVYTSIYIEGIGTYEKVEDGEDSLNGGALGSGYTGILAKVDSAIRKIQNKIIELDLGNKDVELELNVFGFSRGAAAARNFVGRFLKKTASTSLFDKVRNLTWIYPSAKEQIGAGLKKIRQVNEDAEVTVNFVGLYDTVSSYGPHMIYSGETSDVATLNLDMVQYAKKTLHICAADEFRKNFSLTTIQSACGAGTGIEITIPGAHSDIGGTYPQGKYGRVQLVTSMLAISNIGDNLVNNYINYKRGYNNKLYELDRTDKNYSSDGLVPLSAESLKELGWIPEGAEKFGHLELKQFKDSLEDDTASYYDGSSEVSFSNYIKKGYGLVGIDLMIAGADNNQADIFNKIELRKIIKSPTDEILVKIKDLGENCIKNNQSKDIYREISEEDYKYLRSNYLHFSASEGMVNAPRYEEEWRIRVLKRAIIQG